MKITDNINSLLRDDLKDSISSFLEEIDEDVLSNDYSGYQDTLIWKKLFNCQRDASIGIINELKTYNGCILADSVELGKTIFCSTEISYISECVNK